MALTKRLFTAMLVALFVLHISPDAWAAKKKKPKGKGKRPAVVRPVKKSTLPTPPAEGSTPAVATPAPTPAQESPTDQLLSEIRALNEDLEYDKVAQKARKVLERKDLSDDQRADAYLFLGSALAVIADITESIEPFRQLLLIRPDFDLPADTAPRILAAFRKVQTEERERRAAIAKAERERVIAQLALKGDSPREAKGGEPVKFAYQLTDPVQAVTGISLMYRKPQDPSFSSIALQLNGSEWEGFIPGEWTANDDGFTLEYYVRTEDKAGIDLLTLGGPNALLQTTITPGQVESRPFYKSPWFWVITGVSVAGAGTAAYFLYKEGRKPPDSDLGNVQLP